MEAGELAAVGEGKLTRYVRAKARERGRKRPAAEALTVRQAKILAWVAEHGRITRQQTAAVASVSARTAARELAALVEAGRLVADGRPGSSAGYVLAKG